MRIHGSGLLAVIVLLAPVFAPVGAAGRLLTSACDLAIYEERLELENARLAVDLARSRFAAFEQIFGMIDKLWRDKAIERFLFLRAQYDRDAARLSFERADFQLARQEALLEQFHVICDADGADDAEARADRDKALREAQQRYLDADCDQQIKAIEVAKVNLEFNREYRSSVIDLRQSAVATHTQVILAEMDVELEEKRLADAERRAKECKKALGRP